MAQRKFLLHFTVALLCSVLLFAQHLTFQPSSFRLRVFSTHDDQLPLLHPFHFLGNLDRLFDTLVAVSLLCTFYYLLSTHQPSLSLICRIGVLIELAIVAAVLSLCLLTSPSQSALAAAQSTLANNDDGPLTPLHNFNQYQALHLHQPYQHLGRANHGFYAFDDRLLGQVDQLLSSCITLRALYLLAVAAAWWLNLDPQSEADDTEISSRTETSAAIADEEETKEEAQPDAMPEPSVKLEAAAAVVVEQPPPRMQTPKRSPKRPSKKPSSHAATSHS